MVRRIENTKSRKRMQIIEGGKTLFFGRGYRKVTVEDICREAGASRMTFYKYFSNKMELFKTIWDGLIDESYRHLYEIDKTDLSFADKMKEILRYKMEMLRKVSPELIDELLHSDHEIGEYLQKSQERSLQQFLTFTKKAQDRGDMRRLKPEFFLAMIGKMRELLENEQLVSTYPDRLDFIEELNAFFFFGRVPHGEEGTR